MKANITKKIFLGNLFLIAKAAMIANKKDRMPITIEIVSILVEVVLSDSLLIIFVWLLVEVVMIWLVLPLSLKSNCLFIELDVWSLFCLFVDVV